MNYLRASITLIFLSISYLFNAQYNSENLKIMVLDNKEGPANYNISFSYENLRLYPILANDNFIRSHKDIGDRKSVV